MGDSCVYSGVFLTWWGAMLTNYVRTVKYRDVMENMVLCDLRAVIRTNTYTSGFCPVRRMRSKRTLWWIAAGGTTTAESQRTLATRVVSGICMSTFHGPGRVRRMIRSGRTGIIIISSLRNRGCGKIATAFFVKQTIWQDSGCRGRQPLRKDVGVTLCRGRRPRRPAKSAACLLFR